MTNSFRRSTAYELISRVNKITSDAPPAEVKSLQDEIFEFVKVPGNTRSITVLELRILKQFLRRRTPRASMSAAQQVSQALRSQPNAKTQKPDRATRSRPKHTQQNRTPKNASQPKARRNVDPAETWTPKDDADSPQTRNDTLTTKSHPASHSQSKHTTKAKAPTPRELAKLPVKPLASSSLPATPKRAVEDEQYSQQSIHQEADHGNYRTIIRFNPKEAHKLRRRITSWLAEKDIPLEFGRNQAHHDVSKQVFADTIHTEKLTSRFDELKIVEKTNGYFSTKIILATSHAYCYLEVDIVSPEGIFAQPPRFIRRVAQNGSVDGAENGWHAGPVEIGEEELGSLVDYVNSPARALPVFVIGTTRDRTLEAKVHDAKRTWAKFLPGNAVLAILTPDASFRAVNDFGSALAPSPWSIRTYLPGLDRDAPFESRRHRFLGQARLLDDNPIHTASRLGRIATRERALTRAPEPLRQAHKALGEARNRILVKGEFYRDQDKASRMSAALRAVENRTTHELADSELRNVSILKQMIQISHFTEDFTMKLAEAYDAHLNSDLENRLNDLTVELENATEKLDAHAEENRALSSIIDDLESQNAELTTQYRTLAVSTSQAYTSKTPEQEYDELESISELFGVIDSFADLADFFSDFEEYGIRFTCDPKTVSRLDDIDTSGQAIKQTCRALHTLIDYLRSKRNNEFEGSVYKYLEAAPKGYHVVPHKMHASRESESTMSHFGHLRSFPVPTTISNTGYEEMQPHFKLDKIGMKSPRLHYLDASSKSGIIVVGYIGPHLQTEGTN